jgi:hypothetical protein
MIRALVFLGLLLIFGVSVIVLQIFLSRKENKWAGLILPFISFIISLMALLGAVLFSANTRVSTLIEGGKVIEQTVTQIGDMSTIVGTAIYIFLLYNIPTAVLLTIYAAFRGKRNRQRALEKMSVQDLE